MHHWLSQVMTSSGSEALVSCSFSFTLFFFRYLFILLCISFCGFFFLASNYSHFSVISFWSLQNAFQLAFFAWSTVSVSTQLANFMMYVCMHACTCLLLKCVILIHSFCLLQYEFTIHSCFHKRTEDIAIRISMG